MKYLEESSANFFLLLLRILPLSSHARMAVSWLSPSCPTAYTCALSPGTGSWQRTERHFRVVCRPQSGLLIWLSMAALAMVSKSQKDEAMPWLLTIKGIHGDQVQVETFLWPCKLSLIGWSQDFDHAGIVLCGYVPTGHELTASLLQPLGLLLLVEWLLPAMEITGDVGKGSSLWASLFGCLELSGAPTQASLDHTDSMSTEGRGHLLSI